MTETSVVVPAAAHGPAGAEPFEPEDDLAWEATDDRRRRLAARLRSNGQLLAGAGVMATYVAIALAVLARYGTAFTALHPSFDFAIAVSPPGPSLAHPFGVMSGIGVDELDALARAFPVDLVLVAGPILLALAIGVFLGTYAAFEGGTTDVAVTAAADVVVSVPPFFLVIVLFLGLSHYLTPVERLPVFGALFAAILWPYYARPVRARAQSVLTEPYVEASRAAGATRGRLLFRHLVPNSFFPVLAQVPVDVYNIFFVLTVFPFLGCFAGSAGGGSFASVTPLPSLPFPEWGYLLATGACYGWSPAPSADHWWMYAFPALVVLVFGIAVALLCDGAGRLFESGRSPR